MLRLQHFLQYFHNKIYVEFFTNSNLIPSLKLFFYSPILTNNNLLLKIYCENIVVTFLKIFYSLYYFSFINLHFIHTFFFFFSSFPPPHKLSLSLSPFFYLLCLPHSSTFQASSTSKRNFHSLVLSLYFFFFLFFNLIFSRVFHPQCFPSFAKK